MELRNYTGTEFRHNQTQAFYKVRNQTNLSTATPSNYMDSIVELKLSRKAAPGIPATHTVTIRTLLEDFKEVPVK